MKKLFVMMLAFSLTSLLLVGCGAQEDTLQEDTPTEEEEVVAETKTDEEVLFEKYQAVSPSDFKPSSILDPVKINEEKHKMELYYDPTDSLASYKSLMVTVKQCDAYCDKLTSLESFEASHLGRETADMGTENISGADVYYSMIVTEVNEEKSADYNVYYVENDYLVSFRVREDAQITGDTLEVDVMRELTFKAVEEFASAE